MKSLVAAGIVLAASLSTAATAVAQGVFHSGMLRDGMHFRVPLPGKQTFSGGGHIGFHTLAGPVGDTRVIGADLDITFYSDGQTPASDLWVEFDAMLDGERRLFVVRGTDLGFGAGPGVHRAALSTHALDGIVWQAGGFSNSTIDVVIKTESGEPIQGTSFFIGSVLTLKVIPADAVMTVEDFEDFSNQAGWSYGTGNEYISGSDGNGGAFLRDPYIASAIPAAATRPGVQSEFTGDYVAQGVVAVGIDFKSFYFSGIWPSETICLLLYNDNGTPYEWEDDWGAYTVGGKRVPPVVAGPNAAGWFNYDFHVPAGSTRLPEGWVRFGSPKAGNWADLMRDVSGVEFYYGDPSQYHIFRQWDLGLDNPRIFRR